jgi:hypothetical protein
MASASTIHGRMRLASYNYPHLPLAQLQARETGLQRGTSTSKPLSLRWRERSAIQPLAETWAQRARDLVESTSA